MSIKLVKKLPTEEELKALLPLDEDLAKSKKKEMRK